MKKNATIWGLLLGFTICAMIACGGSSGEETDTAGNKMSENAPPATPVVTDGSSKMLFSWFEGDEARTATDISEIPENVRKEVRVQDLSTPPDQRHPDWLFLADLTAKDNQGNYQVKAVKRATYEEKRHPPRATPAKEDAPQAGESAPAVIMYSTAHCPHCKRARRWLLEQKIPYKEFDIEKDEVAAKALYEKCQAQSIMPGGVPMFEINGQIVPGFSPEAILQLLKQPQKVAPSGAPTPLPSPAPSPNSPAQPAAPQGEPANTAPVPSPSTGITI